jgi:rhodanese-related sulfurtransferase
MTYCSGKNCDESFLLTLYLRRQGFTNVVLFTGGFETWTARGHPVERGGR